jgi:uroporphyrinogen decarboxylase
MGFDISLNELKLLTQKRVTLVGNIPPRDVLASGNAGSVTENECSACKIYGEKSIIYFLWRRNTAHSRLGNYHSTY